MRAGVAAASVCFSCRRPQRAPLLHTVVHAGLVSGVALDKQRPIDMTKMRDVSVDASGAVTGVVERGSGGGGGGAVPWATVWRAPPRVVFGHDATRGVQRCADALGLDSGCVYGRELTAAIWRANCPPQLVSVKARRQYAEIVAK